MVQVQAVLVWSVRLWVCGWNISLTDRIKSCVGRQVTPRDIAKPIYVWEREIYRTDSHWSPFQVVVMFSVPTMSTFQGSPWRFGSYEVRLSISYWVIKSCVLLNILSPSKRISLRPENDMKKNLLTWFEIRIRNWKHCHAYFAFYGSISYSFQ